MNFNSFTNVKYKNTHTLLQTYSRRQKAKYSKHRKSKFNKKDSSRLSKYSSTGVFIRWLFWLFWHLFSLFFPTLFFVVTVRIVWELRRIPNERSYIFNNTSNNLNIFKSDGAHSKLHVAKPHQLKRLLHFFKPF